MRAPVAPSCSTATRWAPEGVRGLRSLARLGLSLPAAIAGAAVLAAPVSAHTLVERYQAPLPLLAYVGGAAVAVAASFAFVALRGGQPAPTVIEAAPRRLPGWAQNGLRAVGLVGWAWILLQALLGSTGDADVSSLFGWVYGWVGLALVSALIGPIWSWLDPFSTLHMLLSAMGRRLGLRSADEAHSFPAQLGIWPAVAGFTFVVWLELVGRVEGGRSLGLLIVGYTLFTLAGMSYFGRHEWRRQAEIFSVWFALLGRLAPLALVGPAEDGVLVRRPWAGGLRNAPWNTAHLVLVTLGTGAIIFDGLSQTELYFELLGEPSALVGTLIAAAFMAVMLGLVLGVARRLGERAVGAGLLPVAVGYLIAHYLSFLLIDGQRIVLALNDPLGRGDNLLPLGLEAWEPALFLPTALVWSIQLAAVVGGHVVGAWAGHAQLALGDRRSGLLRQLPLAGLMVLFTSITLWSLGQSVLVEDEEESAGSHTAPIGLSGHAEGSLASKPGRP
jgi:hypothetical protein